MTPCLSDRSVYRLILILASSVAIILSTAARADLAVLQYHHIADDTPPSTSTSPALFRQQMDLLKDLHIEVVPLAQATHEALAGASVRPRVAISFDDAYSSIFTTAWPELKKRGYPFTVFVNTDAVDEGIRDYMDWLQLRMLSQATGVTLGNHSADHGHLVRGADESPGPWRRRVEQSLQQAQDKLTSRLGVKPELFAYPYGEYSHDLEALVRERGWLAYGQQSGAIGRQSDPQALPRFPAANAYGQIDSLRNKVLSLAFPVNASTLPNPLLARNPPALTLTVPGDWTRDRLHCYGSGRGKLKLEWSDQQVTVMADGPFRSRRFRYNCTYPASQGRFYWLSQPWINQAAPKD